MRGLDGRVGERVIECVGGMRCVSMCGGVY